MRRRVSFKDDGPSLVLHRLFDEIRGELRSGSPTIVERSRDMSKKMFELHTTVVSHVEAEDECEALSLHSAGKATSQRDFTFAYDRDDPCSRPRVYEAIDGERAYQDSRWNAETSESGGVHSVAEWLVLMQDYQREAMTQWTRGPDPYARIATLNTIRKIAAMCVACMEQNGAPLR